MPLNGEGKDQATLHPKANIALAREDLAKFRTC